MFIKSGGGSFDYKVESNGTNKIGKWTDISEFFSEYQFDYFDNQVMLSNLYWPVLKRVKIWVMGYYAQTE